ncbi:MAG: PIN domain-containing protein, partial [Propionivibrio sp.]
VAPLSRDSNGSIGARDNTGLRSGTGASREVLRLSLKGRFQPLFGNALWLEYQDLLGRPVWGEATSPDERMQVLAALARQGRWITVYYRIIGDRPRFSAELR